LHRLTVLPTQNIVYTSIIFYRILFDMKDNIFNIERFTISFISSYSDKNYFRLNWFNAYTVKHIYFLLVIFFSLHLDAMTQTSDCQNKTGTICNNTFRYNNRPHSLQESTAHLSSPVNLTSCENGNSSLNMYWFYYNDICHSNTTLDKSFAIVSSNNIAQCKSRSDISITYDSCKDDYIFTRQSMIIKNITHSTSQKYVYILSVDSVNTDYTFAIIDSINISGQFI